MADAPSAPPPEAAESLDSKLEAFYETLISRDEVLRALREEKAAG
jgi:hypothetical protein